MHRILEKIQETGIIPVVVIDRAEDAEPLAEALIRGGLPCAEVTFRTEAAEEAIWIMSEKYPQMLIGAGTVLTKDQVDRAKKAGAQFIVSPGFNPKTVKYCQEQDILITPGCSTASELELAVEYGLEVVKFFPAEQAGGLPMIKALAGPFHKMKFMPTGGISAGNVNAYLEYDRVLACGGSWMVKGDLIRSGNFEKITELVKEAVELVKKSRR